MGGGFHVIYIAAKLRRRAGSRSQLDNFPVACAQARRKQSVAVERTDSETLTTLPLDDKALL